MTLWYFAEPLQTYQPGFSCKTNWENYGLGLRKIIPAQKYRLGLQGIWFERSSNSSNAQWAYETKNKIIAFPLNPSMISLCIVQHTGPRTSSVFHDATETIHEVREVRKIDYLTSIRCVSLSAQKFNPGD